MGYLLVKIKIHVKLYSSKSSLGVVPAIAVKSGINFARGTIQENFDPQNLSREEDSFLPRIRHRRNYNGEIHQGCHIWCRSNSTKSGAPRVVRKVVPTIWKVQPRKNRTDPLVDLSRPRLFTADIIFTPIMAILRYCWIHCFGFWWLLYTRRCYLLGRPV